MELAIWDPSYDQVARKSNNCMGGAWLCDFYFGYGHDVIEENALNEKFCIQVLKILIKNADSEIDELEEDLVILQSQLAWADEEWSKLCLASLREKIDCLDISIRSLKSKSVHDEHGLGVCLPIPREPAERVEDIVKALLRNYYHQRDEKSIDAVVEESGSDNLHATDLLENRRLINSASDSRKKEVEDLSNTLAERQPILNSSSKSTGKKTECPGTFKQVNNIGKGYSLDSLGSSSGLGKGTKILNNFDSKSSGKVEGNIHGLATVEDCSSEKFSLNPQVERTNPLKSIKFQDGCDEQHEDVINDSNTDTLRHATDNCSEKKEFNKFNPNVNQKRGVKIPNSVPKDTSKILVTSMKPEGNGTDLLKTVKPANVTLRDSSSDTPIHASPKEKNEFSKINSKVNGEKEVREHDSIDKSIILKSSLEPGGKGTNISETVEEHAADKVLDSISNALNDETEDSDANPNQNKGPEATQTGKIDSSNSSLKAETKRKRTSWKVRVQEARCTYSEHIAADSLLKLLHPRGKDTTKRRTKKKCKAKCNQVQKTETADKDDEGIHNSSLNPQRSKVEKKFNPNPVDVQEKGVVQSQKERKRNSNPPVFENTEEIRSLQMSLVKLHDDTTDTANEDLWVSDGSNNETYTLTNSTTNILDVGYLSVNDLRVIAKSHKVRGYYKLRKAELAEKLGLKVQHRGEKKKRKKEPALRVLMSYAGEKKERKNKPALPQMG